VNKEFSIAKFLANTSMNYNGNYSYIYRRSSTFAATMWLCRVNANRDFLLEYATEYWLGILHFQGQEYWF